MKDTDEFKLVNELFPHVGNNVEVFWGSKDFVDYVDNLFFDTRDGTRQGFPQYILSALASLKDIHDRRFPEFVKKDKDKIPFTFRQKRY